MTKIIVLLFVMSHVIITCKSKVSGPTNNQKEVNYIPYYLKVYEADSLQLTGNYKQSQQILDSLFKKYEPLNQESYGEYTTYLKNKVTLNDFKNIDLVLQKAVQDFGLKVEHCLKDSLIKIAVKKAKFKESDLKGFYESYTSKLNLEYRYAIEEMIVNDQRVRLAVPRNNKDWEKVDRENAARLKLLISKYGYPSVNKIGRYDFTNRSARVSTLFLHASTEAREGYILDLMLEAVKKGECEPSNFAVVYDKYLMVTGQYGDKVYYGELRSRKKSIDEQVVNPKKIDSIRTSIGLEHIDYINWKLKKVTGYDMFSQ